MIGQNVKIGLSHIPGAGLGCFSTNWFEPLEPIAPTLRENFRFLTEPDVPPRYLKYCVRQNDGRYLAPEQFEQMNPLWFINHQRDPNCVFERHRLRAARLIAPGEELTVYYSDLLTHPCNQLWVKDIDIRELATA